MSTTTSTAVAHPVGAGVVLDALRAIGTTHVVIVPDTNQRTVLELLDTSDIPVVRAATEDDVAGICAGLWMAGAKPVALIQQLGLFAAVNAIRGVTHDMQVPLAILAGLYGRELDRAPEDSSSSAVRLCTPMLDALELRWTLIEHSDAAGDIAPGLAAAFDEQCTSIVLLGAPTS
jgi:sulfopyruvate decarboxylase TPP-binding subunit